MRFSAASVWESETMTYYLDSHAHIISEEFGEDFDAVLERADQADVKRIMIMCTEEKEIEPALELVRRDPFRFQCAYGIHPEDADRWESRWDRFLEIIQDPLISCVGEIGLDYHWVKDNKEVQQELFIRQIEAARQVRKPILVHSRDAMQDTYDIMKEHRIPGVMHCFAGSAEMAQEFTKLGYYLAFGGAITFKNSRHSKEAAAAVDTKYLLSETDCPYMSPEPVRGRRNEPSNIPHIVKVIADVCGKSREEMADIIAENYDRLLHEEVK